jgi:transketolase
MNMVPKIASSATHDEMANAIRALAMDAVEKANSGHPGMPMGMADVATVLFTRFLKFDPTAPQWPDRDRFVLSAGHGSMLLYAVLHLTGYGLTIDDIKNFRQLGSKTPGHPEYGHTPGVEVTTGPLGQGVAAPVGMALAERMLATRFGPEIVDHYTYVIAGDGCLMEGISQEAIALAGHLKLNKLIVFWDNNGITIDGKVELADSVDQVKRFEAAGWAAWHIDGHDPEAIAAAIEKAQKSDVPVMIACKTTIGFGAPTKAGTAGAHGAALGAEELAGAKKALGWNEPAFVIPAHIQAAWSEAGGRGTAMRTDWEKRHAALPVDAAQKYSADFSGAITAAVAETIDGFKKAATESGAAQASRTSSQKILDLLAKAQPNLLGGSADLTHSNLTHAKDTKSVTAADYSGSYIHYGIREFGMAAAMNGIAVHGGFIPYGGTFLVFSDYARPAIRLAALMGIRVIYVLTHDSIGLGEDGPTHQPVEHLAALRAIPNLLVLRPGDPIETAEAWELALNHATGPSALALSRQNLPVSRKTHTSENLSAKGGYLLRETAKPRDVTLIATGSEVGLAMQAAEKLAAEGIEAAVVSVPCFELFAEQSADYRAMVLGSAPRIGIEAAIRQSWDMLLRPDDPFIGMKTFGASGSIADVYKHFGITVEAILADVKSCLGRAA